jgi:hypothetical protein
MVCDNAAKREDANRGGFSGTRRLLATAYVAAFLFAANSGLAQGTLKETAKTVGQIVRSQVRVSVPLFATSRITIVNGDMNGKVLPVVAGSNLGTVATVNSEVTEGKRQNSGKTKQFVPVVLAPGEQVSLIVSNHTQFIETVSIILKYYDQDNKFVAASEPRDFHISPAPSTTNETWVFRNTDLKTR